MSLAPFTRVKDGRECARVIESTGGADYQKTLGEELEAIGNSEMWLAGKATRCLRPKEAAREIGVDTKGVGGRVSN